MKRIYIILAAAMFMSLGAMAQQITKPLSGLKALHTDDVTAIYPSSTGIDYKTKADTQSSWLSPVSMWESQGAFWQSGSFIRLFPDSSVKILPSEGEAYKQNWHMFGTVFEPADPFYQDQTSTSWSIDLYDTYRVDSVRLSYGYFRNADSMMVNGSMAEIVDTAIVQFYTPENLSRWYIGTVGNWEDHVFTIPRGSLYDPTTVATKGNAFNDTILLPASAETPLSSEGTFTIGLLKSKIPSSVGQRTSNGSLNGAHTVGMSVTYHPMQPYSFGDTLASFRDGVTVTNQLNNFGVLVYFNEGAEVAQDRYANNSFVTNTQVVGGDTLFDLFRGYLCTTASAGWNSDFFFDGDFYIVAALSSVSEINTLGVSAYPNPAIAGQEILVNIDENASMKDVNIEMIDVLGNVINTEIAPKGNNQFGVATEGLSAGIYFVNVKANNSAGTVRVIISE